MSGPKLMELRRLRRAARRQHNLDLCGGFDLEYPRLFAELRMICRQLEVLGEVSQCTLAEPAIAASEAAEALRNNRDDEAVKVYERRVLSAREEIEAARNRVASRLVELRERHRIAGYDLDRLRAERQSLLATIQAVISGTAGKDTSVRHAFLEDAKRLQEIAILDSIEWGRVPADDAAAVSRAEIGLGQLSEELRKARARLEEFVQQSSKTPGPDLTPASQPLSFSEYWAKRGPAIPVSASVGAAPAPFSMASLEALLKQAAALPTSDLYLDLCERTREVESTTDPEARRARGEALLIQGARQIRDRKKLLQFREEVRAMIDQAAPFEELAAEPLMEDLNRLLAAAVPIDLDSLGKHHKELLDRARARREREAKRRALLDSLRELGYLANENMETAFTDSGRLVVHKPDENEYAIEFVADASMDKVQTAMLRYSGSAEMSEQQRLRDREHEASWCGDHGKLRQLMERRGWESGLKMQRPAGEHPVRVVVDPARAPREAVSRARKTAKDSSR